MRERRAIGGVRDDSAISFGEKRTTDANGGIRVSTRDGGKNGRIRSMYAFLFIDRTAVSVRQFRHFVKESKYKTDAEKFKWSFVLNGDMSSTVLEESDGRKGWDMHRKHRGG